MFYTIRRFIEGIRLIRNPEFVAAAGTPRRGGGDFLQRKKLELLLQVTISLALLGAGVYIVISNQYSEAASKIAAGWVGVVVGYWLR